MTLIEAQKTMQKLGFDFAAEKEMKPYDLSVNDIIVTPVNLSEFMEYEKSKSWANLRELDNAYPGDWTLIVIFRDKENNRFVCSYERFIKENEIDS